MESIYFLLTSILTRTFSAGTPLLLGTLGEIYSERAGVLNLGIEGILAIGAVSAFSVATITGNPWLGVLAAIVAGLFCSLLHAFVTISLKANQIVSGLALTMLGLGISGLWGKAYIGTPLKHKFTAFKIPVLAEIPLLGKVLFYQDPIFYLSILIGITLWFILYHSRWGIVIRSVGENPIAAESLGVNIYKTRYLCVLLGGGLAGLAGSYLSLVYIPSWIEGMTGGRGWIVIALTVFSMWNPARAFLGAYLFGGIYVLQYFLQSTGISPNLLLMLPYLSTLLVLLWSSRSSRTRKICAPASLGIPFDKQK